MYLADQWIRESSARQKMADTSYAYRPILRKYGYTDEDFRRSIGYYTDRPKEFASVFEQVSNSLRGDKKGIETLERQEIVRDSIRNALNALPFRRPDFVSLPETDYYVAGLYLYRDSTGVYAITPVNIFADSAFVRPQDKPFVPLVMLSGQATVFENNVSSLRRGRNTDSAGLIDVDEEAEAEVEAGDVDPIDAIPLKPYYK